MLRVPLPAAKASDTRRELSSNEWVTAIPATGAGSLLPITTGTFAAPEERQGQSLDARCDLYSLGGVLYVAATGAPSPGDVRLLRSRRPDLPSSFADLVASLLCEAPDDRPGDAESVLKLLDEVRHASTVDALIAAGEGQSIEFKSSLHHPYGPLPPDLQAKPSGQAQKEIRKRLHTAVTKTIAAFLNTSGGTLLIGVDDSGGILGIEPDLSYLRPDKQNTDGWLQSLRTVITNALGADVWSAIHASLVRHGQQIVAVIHCPARTSETWHHDNAGELFYMRASNTTPSLTGSSLVRYIRERWPA